MMILLVLFSDGLVARDFSLSTLIALSEATLSDRTELGGVYLHATCLLRDRRFMIVTDHMIMLSYQGK